MPRESRDTSDHDEAPPDTTGVEPEALQPTEQEQPDARHLTANAEQYLATHPPTPDDLQTREDRLDHADAALHTPEPDDSTHPPSDAQMPDERHEPLEDTSDYVHLTVEAERYLADHPPGPEDHDTRDTLLDHITPSLQDQPHDPAFTTDAPRPPELHEPSPPRLEEETVHQEPSRNLEPIWDPPTINQPDVASMPAIEDSQPQPQEPTNPTPPANLSLERDLQQPHDNQLPARSESKELTPRERLEPARAPSDPLALITAFASSDAKEGERPSLSQRLAALDRLLDQNPYLRNCADFRDEYRHAQTYIVLKAVQRHGDLPSIARQDMAQRLGIPSTTLHDWLIEKSQPKLIRKLVFHENARQRHEAEFSAESRDRRVDPSLIHKFLEPLRDSLDSQNPGTLAEALESLYRGKNPSPNLLIAELAPYHERGPLWLQDIAKTIEKQREEIEQHLTQRLATTDDSHFVLRIGVVNHTVYLWRRDTNPDSWPNVYAHEHFRFGTSAIKNQLIDEARKNLDLDSDSKLGSLVLQLTEHPAECTTTKVSDLRRRGSYLIGESLHFLLDATGRDFSNLQSSIAHLGRDTQGGSRSGIDDPRFPTGVTLDEFRARAFAIIASDGSISRTKYAVDYGQTDSNRVEYVKQLFCTALGNIHYREVSDSAFTELVMSVVVGRLFEKWGIPTGDKIIGQFQLPSTITEGSPRVKRAYLEELIPEEGCFHTEKSCGVFEWRRAMILDAGQKAERYQFESIISSEQKDLIRSYGKKCVYEIRDERPREAIEIRWTELDRLALEAESSLIQRRAEELGKLILKNPCQLLESERQLCESLGIEVSTTPEKICLYQTGRVSVIWRARTASQDDALRWAILAPPSTGLKREKVERWAGSREQLKQVRERLQSEGVMN